ncbi:hypothetical protein [Candidatus Spyradosoma sp. SGI.093]|uniref:hypothetical protein n=1 Tax=Candidatus Spyradosoma sp. SGI.093 TaxID=3420583 RepID=UPI003D0833FF
MIAAEAPLAATEAVPIVKRSFVASGALLGKFFIFRDPFCFLRLQFFVLEL